MDKTIKTFTNNIGKEYDVEILPREEIESAIENLSWFEIAEKVAEKHNDRFGNTIVEMSLEDGTVNIFCQASNSIDIETHFIELFRLPQYEVENMNQDGEHIDDSWVTTQLQETSSFDEEAIQRQLNEIYG